MGPSNVWWILGAIFIIIGIVFIILHFQKEKVSGNTTIQKVFLYGGIILLAVGIIMVAFWVIKKLTGKPKGQRSGINVDINQYPPGYSNSYGYNMNQNQYYGMNQNYPNAGYNPAYNPAYNPSYNIGY
jgi:hypothetical protein